MTDWDELTADTAKTKAFTLASQDLKVLISRLETIKKAVNERDGAHVEEALKHIIEAQMSLYRAGP